MFLQCVLNVFYYKHCILLLKRCYLAHVFGYFSMNTILFK